MFPTGKIVSADITRLMFYVSVLGVLLLLGVLLRSKVSVFKKLFLPASLIAGVIGLLLGEYGVGLLPAEMTQSWAALPGSLIVIAFAPMLIGPKAPKTGGQSESLKDIFVPQLIVGTVGSFIQVAIPCLVAYFLLTPLWHVDKLFPSIIEIGWAGGHGTAGGMAEVFEKLGWDHGVTLGLTSATAGLLFGIVGGMFMINHAIRKGYLSPDNDLSAAAFDNAKAFMRTDEKISSAYQTVNNNVVEGFALHLAIIGVAVILGIVIQKTLGRVIDGLPLFPMAMLGGLLLNVLLNRSGLIQYVDKKTFQRIQNTSIDFLIVAAIASIRLSVILDNVVPLLIIFACSALSMLWYFYWICPRIFKKDWFEQGILHFGVNTGVTAVGFMLLRSVDPDMKTISVEAYALQAPFTSPLLGGGLLTSVLPALIVRYGNLNVGLASSGIVIACLLIAKIFGCWHKPIAAKGGIA